MRVIYDHIVEVDQLRRPISLPHLRRSNGWAVLLEGLWFWFADPEPAYAFGRSGRMSNQVGSWDLVEAATEARFDEKTRRDIFTLYLAQSARVASGPGADRELLQRFLDGVDPRSSHWPSQK